MLSGIAATNPASNAIRAPRAAAIHPNFSGESDRAGPRARRSGRRHSARIERCKENIGTGRCSRSSSVIPHWPRPENSFSLLHYTEFFASRSLGACEETAPGA